VPRRQQSYKVNPRRPWTYDTANPFPIRRHLEYLYPAIGNTYNFSVSGPALVWDQVEEEGDELHGLHQVDEAEG
jgi:hypothetical protein